MSVRANILPLLVLINVGAVFCQHQVCLKVPAAINTCFDSFKGQPISEIAAQISCLQDLLWSFKPDTTLTPEDASFLQELVGNMTEATNRKLAQTVVATAGPDSTATKGSQGRSGGYAMSTVVPWDTYPPSGPRVRREYRTLTHFERARFHRALRKLYRSGRYRTFAKMHTEAANLHHNGASFLPWHRMYLVMLEEALRVFEPGVFIPYWASTIDDAMDNPVNSLLWTRQYMGNGDGDVVSGPAAYWVSAVGRLQRRYGRFSRLMKNSDIAEIMTHCYLSNMTFPLENYHGGPHVWVGGDMSGLDTAAYDPIFFMHHAFIDYIWEKFRHRQATVCGVDPSTDYPTVSTNSERHRPYDAMVGFKWWTNKDGIRSSWTDNWYSYADAPTCPDCCPGCGYLPPIVCDSMKNVCVAASRFTDKQITSRAFGLVAGRLPPDAVSRSEAEAFSAAMGLPTEKTDAPARNRGRLFAAPPSDGRTVFTAARDILAARSGGTV